MLLPRFQNVLKTKALNSRQSRVLLHLRYGTYWNYRPPSSINRSIFIRTRSRLRRTFLKRDPTAQIIRGYAYLPRSQSMVRKLTYSLLRPCIPGALTDDTKTGI